MLRRQPLPAPGLLQAAGRTRETGFLRLQAPTTLTSKGSPLIQGLPHPVSCAFRVCYPLSALLLPKPLSYVSSSSVLGVVLFRVFLPLKSASPLGVDSSLALFPVRLGLQNRHGRDFRVLPFKERCSQHLLLHECWSLYSPEVDHPWGVRLRRSSPLQVTSSFALPLLFIPE